MIRIIQNIFTPSKYLFLVFFLFVFACNANAEFTRDASKQIVTDSTTGLMWQDDEAAKTTSKNWEDAGAYCENLSMDGYDDWRLPSIDELQTITDLSKDNPALNSVFSNVTQQNNYWSSTAFVGFSVHAWIVYSGNGDTGGNGKSSENYVRCVRGGQFDSFANFADKKISGFSRDATKYIVTDAKNSLIWQDDEAVITTQTNWEEAVAYCESLSMGGYDDWRLPSVDELHTISDYYKHSPALNSAFSNFTQGSYWSSTNVNSSVHAWIVYSLSGGTDVSSKSNENYVRCVRGGQLVPSSHFPKTFADNAALISVLQSADTNIEALNLSTTLSKSLSRAEAVYLLDASLRLSVPVLKVDLSEYPLPFGDVDEESMYGEALKRLSYYKGSDGQTVITKENALFNPLRPTSRQEFVKMVLQGFNLPYSNSSYSLSTFSDTANIADWAVQYFKYAVQKGIILGNAGKLLPTDNITREEALNILHRTFNVINGSYMHDASGYEAIGETIGLSKEISDVSLDALMPDMTATPITINGIIQGSGTQRRTLAATITADTEKGATPYCYWYTDWGYLEKSTSTNNSSVYFHPALTAPNEEYTITAQCYDGLGFYDEKTITIPSNDFSYTASQMGNYTLSAGVWPTTIFTDREVTLPLIAKGDKDGLLLGVEYVKVWLTDGITNQAVFEGRPVGNQLLFVTPDNSIWYGKNITIKATVQFPNGAIAQTSQTSYLKPDYRINGQVVVKENGVNVSTISIGGQSFPVDSFGYFSAQMEEQGNYTISIGVSNATVGFETKSVTLTSIDPIDGVILFQDDIQDINSTYVPTTQQTNAIISPSNGVTLTSGSSATITWNQSVLTGDTIKLYVLHDNPTGLVLNNTILTQKNWYLFGDNLSNTGSFAFNPLIMNGTGNAYKILAVSNTGNWSVSSGTFTLASSDNGVGTCTMPTGMPPMISDADVTPTGVSVRKDNEYFYFNFDYNAFPTQYVQLVNDSGGTLEFKDDSMKKLELRIWYKNCQWETVAFYSDINNSGMWLGRGDAELTATGIKGRIALSDLATKGITLPTVYTTGGLGYYFYKGHVEDSTTVDTQFKTPITLSDTYQTLTPLPKVSIQLNAGWNLMSSFRDFDPSMINDDPLLEMIWYYKNNLWYATSPMNAITQQSLNQHNIPHLTSLGWGDGFWVKLSGTSDTFEESPFNIIANPKLINATTGWTMLGAGSDITPSDIHSANGNIKTIWVYRNGEWYLDYNGALPNGVKKLESLHAGEGFWIYVK